MDTKAGWGKPKRKRVISDGVAYEVTKILEENVQCGTGVGANFGRPAAGKTGTTENYADAWFCGYTPQLDGGGLGRLPAREIPMTSVHGIAVAGGTFPATIWRLFMQTGARELAAHGLLGADDGSPTFDGLARRMAVHAARTSTRPARRRTTTTTSLRRHRTVATAVPRLRRSDD